MTAAHADPAVLYADARTSIADLRIASDVARRGMAARDLAVQGARAERDRLRLALNQPPAGPDTFAEAQQFADIAVQYGVDVDATAVVTS